MAHGMAAQAFAVPILTSYHLHPSTLLPQSPIHPVTLTPQIVKTIAAVWHSGN
ncbi:MAG: hypothetical protein F6K00_15550 [Leptolyngbya sp. SIOISBB]|nr:hypothetical protein [Leptolyngbya sp. SIOISBB]